MMIVTIIPFTPMSSWSAYAQLRFPYCLLEFLASVEVEEEEEEGDNKKQTNKHMRSLTGQDSNLDSYSLSLVFVVSRFFCLT